MSSTVLELYHILHLDHSCYRDASNVNLACRIEVWYDKEYSVEVRFGRCAVLLCRACVVRRNT